MEGLSDIILITWRRNGAYAQRLVGDLSDADWLAQPVPGRLLNHPAWILSHLNVYAPLCTAMLLGQPWDDPIDHPIGQKSEVRTEPGTYPPGAELLKTYVRLHAEAEQALAAAPADRLAAPNPLERAQSMHPTLGSYLVTLMVKHETGHLGQLSAWRRAMGLPRVAM